MKTDLIHSNEVEELNGQAHHFMLEQVEIRRDKRQVDKIIALADKSCGNLFTKNSVFAEQTHHWLVLKSSQIPCFHLLDGIKDMLSSCQLLIQAFYLGV